jgi:apolipoprotein N-acyltransferase
MLHSIKWQVFLGTLFSGICWYVSFDLSFHAWWALWLAPIPLLYLAPRLSGWQAFGMAFVALLIGRLSWFSFLHAVLPLGVALLLTVLFPLLLGLIILIVRKIIAVSRPAVSIFAYPVLWTAFEYLTFLYSRDGTAASIANTQSDFLPLLQIASLTGVMGITFLLCFVPSGIALVCHRRREGKKFRGLLLSVLLPIAAVLSFGLIRLSGGQTRDGLTAGLAAIPMSAYHGRAYDRRPEAALPIAGLYLQEVGSLAAGGAKIILLPEKAIAVSDSTAPVIRNLFLDAARRLGVTIIVGINSLANDHLACQAWVISPGGRLLLDYRKVNLFEGETADGFIAGKEPGFFSLNGSITGVAICKDLDFDRYIRLYRQGGVAVLYVPAWDFDRDGWIHSRVAMMRAVENGYTLVRNAQQGRLTISDDRGRVLGEASSEDNQRAVLIGKIGASEGPTFYNRWGDWFGWLDLLAAVYFLFLIATRKRGIQK